MGTSFYYHLWWHVIEPILNRQSFHVWCLLFNVLFANDWSNFIWSFFVLIGMHRSFLWLVLCHDFFYFATWGVVGTGGGAEAPHAALSTEKEEGELDTAKALYGAFHPLPGNQGHMVIVNGQFPGATFLGQGQGLHQCIVPPHLIPHLWSMQVMRNLSPRPGLGHCLVALVVEARKVWFRTGMALLIQLGSRFPPGHWNVFYYRWPLAVDLVLQHFVLHCYCREEKRFWSLRRPPRLVLSL